MLRQVTMAAFRLVPHARVVSVTLRGPDGELLTPTESEELADQLDRIQYDTGMGPCVDTAQPDGPGFVLSEDLREETRWPRFAAAAAAHTRELAELTRTHLNRALESRDVIGQAKGILMARRGLTADLGFELLRRTSQNLNIKLAELAGTLSSRHGDLDPPA